MRNGLPRAAFVWGVAVGVFCALGLVIGNDFGWNIWPGPDGRAAKVGTIQSKPVSLFLQGVPLGYTVHVDGGDADAEHTNSGISLFVSEGPHTISLKGPEGLVWSETIAASYPDTLAPYFGGEIAVDVLPQAIGGDLYLDGKRMGRAPGAIAEVVPGWHRVAVKNGEEILYEESCYVLSGNVTVVSVPPAPPLGRAQLNIKSRILTEIGFQPLQGSTVYVNGEKKGKVPLALDLPCGFHSVRVEHRTQDTVIEVLYLPAGQTRQLLADFGREDRLQVRALVPQAFDSGIPAAIPVTIHFQGEAAELKKAEILLVRGNQAKPMMIPLSPVQSDPNTWLAYLPKDLLKRGNLRGYASCMDAFGRSGQSELFSVIIR